MVGLLNGNGLIHQIPLISPPAIETTDICDANVPLLSTGELRVLLPMFQSYGARRAFHGKVVTVRTFEDNKTVLETLQEFNKKERKMLQQQQQLGPKVMVIDGGGSLRRALSGSVFARLAQEMGWAGIVVNGCIRDVEEINELDIGYKALGTCPVRPYKRTSGEKHVPVHFAGALIKDGDWLYSDSNAILVSTFELSELGRSYTPVLHSPQNKMGTPFYSHTIADYHSHCEPYHLFQAHCLDDHNFMPNYLPQFFKRVEFVQGNSTSVGCVKLHVLSSQGSIKYVKYRVDELEVGSLYMKYTIVEGDILGEKWDSIVCEIKIQPSVYGSHLKITGQYYPNNTNTTLPTADDVKSSQDYFSNVHKAVQEMLSVYPHLYL